MAIGRSDNSQVADSTPFDIEGSDFDSSVKTVGDALRAIKIPLTTEQYIPFAAVQESNFKGLKGQWSFNNGFYYFCVATDTWTTLVDKVYVDAIKSTIFAQFANQYVPCCLVPSNSAPGLKGQWSFEVGHSSHKGYVKICIATNTWVRFEVDTLF